MFRTALALTVASAVISVASSPSAHAAALRIQDARGDMFRDDAARPGGELRPAPRQRRGDIRATTIRHNHRRVVVRVKLAALRRRGDGSALSMRLRTDERRWRAVRLTVGRGQENGWRGTVYVARRNGRPVDCPTAHDVSYPRNVMVVRIPRSCLGAPRWVQATVISMYASRGATTFFYDNAHHDRANFATWSGRVRRG